MELKRREKIEKYQDLVREMRTIWKVKTEVIPLVIGALSTVPKELETHLETRLELNSLWNYIPINLKWYYDQKQPKNNSFFLGFQNYVN